MEDDMKTSLHKTIILSLAAIFSLSIAATTVAIAADDPSIKGALRENIKASMVSFIKSSMINDSYYIYDAVGGKLLKLKFAKLHEGVVKKGDFYVSCADFVDKNGTKVDLDFLVIKDGDNLKTIQAVVHSLDGKKRKYHLEG
jgi:hypothetical protein